MTEPSREEIAATAAQIAPYVRVTPIVELDGADFGLARFSLTAKLELLQHAGSFKTRGAFANLLSRAIPAAGVVAASGGNHGAAVAYAAKQRGVRAKIFVPSVSSPAKQQRIRAYGGDLAVVEGFYADALRASVAWAAESGALAIHAFDQYETLLGQGTLGREVEQQAPALDTLLIACGGGGLVGGVAAWCRGAIRVIAVEPRAAPTLHDALRAGEPVDAPAGGVAADSLGAGRIGALVLPIAQRFIERVVLVEDDAIVAAQRALWSVSRVVAEPGGATPLAALLSGAYTPAPGERVGMVVSGANTSAVSFG